MRLTIDIVESYSPRDEEESAAYQKAIYQAVTEAQKAFDWKIKQFLGKSVILTWREEAK